jgi:hypothetical protein
MASSLYSRENHLAWLHMRLKSWTGHKMLLVAHDNKQAICQLKKWAIWEIVLDSVTNHSIMVFRSIRLLKNNHWSLIIDQWPQSSNQLYDSWQIQLGNNSRKNLLGSYIESSTKWVVFFFRENAKIVLALKNWAVRVVRGDQSGVSTPSVSDGLGLMGSLWGWLFFPAVCIDFRFFTRKNGA